MSYRLQVLVSDSVHARLKKAAARRRISPGAFARLALENALTDASLSDPLAQLESLNAPSGDIAQMLAEIEAGRR